jgi:sulfatase modifying factor 1
VKRILTWTLGLALAGRVVTGCSSSSGGGPGGEDGSTPGATRCDGSVGSCCPGSVCDAGLANGTMDSGAEALSDAPDDSTEASQPAACLQGERSCSGQQPLTCDTNGNWQSTGSPCGSSQTCVGGVCTDVCGPGQTTCSGSTPQTCGSNGQWQDGPACTGNTPFCVAGACSAEPASCVAGGEGLTNCGASSESCCTSPGVTGGIFYRVYTDDGDAGIEGSQPATVSNFRLDKYDVTVGRFRQFVNAVLPADGGVGWTPPAGSGKHTHVNGGQGLWNVGNVAPYEPGWVAADDAQIAPTDTNLSSCSPTPFALATWTPSAGTQENLPINCVNWFEAYAFCIWDGGFLPSIVEWEYAAAGGNQQREYPWGSADPGTSNEYAIYNCNYDSSDGGQCPSVGSVAPVGTAALGAGLWGQLDLAGNLLQWQLDWGWSQSGPCTDCASLQVFPGSASMGAGSAGRETTGSTFFGDVSTLPVAFGGFTVAPSFRFNGLGGFRCARTP